MAQRNEPEGELGSDDNAAAQGLWLDNATTPLDRSRNGPVGQRTGVEKKLLGVLIGIVVVWGLFVGLGRVVSPDTTIDEEAAAAIEQTRVDREVERALQLAEEARLEEVAAEEERLAREAAQEAADAAVAEAEDSAAIADVAGDYGAADAAPGFPQVTVRPGQVVQIVAPGDALRVNPPPSAADTAERLGRQLQQRSTSPYVAYESAIGVVLIDLLTTQAWILELPGGMTAAEPGQPLLRSGSQTYGIDSSTGAITRVGTDGSLVVSDAVDGGVYFVDARTLVGQAALIEVIDGGAYGFHRIPQGVELRGVDGLGLLAVPKGPTGQTLISRTDSFEQLSENRVLTGSKLGLVEQVCDGPERCSLAVTSLADGEQQAVPSTFSRFGDQYALSPDGRQLLRHTSQGYGEVLFVESNAVAWVVGAGMQEPVWGPTSDYVAWLELIGPPKLKVMFTDERDWLTVDLQDYGVPAPLNTSLLVFEGAEPSAEAG